MSGHNSNEFNIAAHSCEVSKSIKPLSLICLTIFLKLSQNNLKSDPNHWLLLFWDFFPLFVKQPFQIQTCVRDKNSSKISSINSITASLSLSTRILKWSINFLVILIDIWSTLTQILLRGKSSGSTPKHVMPLFALAVHDRILLLASSCVISGLNKSWVYCSLALL